ncbi:surfeit locus protein 6 homolog [Chelonus insularis]|uniref:surfeit locus protein 6 homolog n=1 Tax=Chelonus insularis TaxID=460826 RepID=UPI00158DF940|nr:surfeit locus protein 6 homolog [Chelonus insularis]
MFNTFDVKKVKEILKKENNFIQDIFSKMPLPVVKQDPKIKTESGVQKISTLPRTKPVFNSEGHMVFSKFDFSEIGTKHKPKKYKNKKPTKILEQLNQKKRKFKELEESGDNEHVKTLKEKESWTNVIAKANGVKVKDDPELLKRTIKLDEQKKKKSSKKWEARIAATEKAKEERQKKRQENIMKRKKEKKLNKLKKASKKGRIIPGF